MDLRALRYFLCVVEAQSFSRAAVYLHIAQPALSRQVRKLEEELGTPLLIRSGRGLELTEAGALLLQRGESLMRFASQMVEDVKAQASALSGSVAVGTTLITGQRLAPALLRHCNEHCPTVHVSLVEGLSGYIYERFLRNELTLCLLHNPPPHEGIILEQLLAERLFLVGPPRNQKRARLNPDAWHSYPLVMPNRTHSLRMLVENLAREQNVSLDARYTVDGPGMTHAIVAAGLAYAVLPASVAQKLMDDGLEGSELPHSEASWILMLASKSDQKNARPVQAIKEAIRVIVASFSKDKSNQTSVGVPDRVGRRRGYLQRK